MSTQTEENDNPKAGAVWGWGSNQHRQIIPSTLAAEPAMAPFIKGETIQSPCYIPGLFPDVRVVKVACGRTHCVVLTLSRAVYVWGSGAMGKLGLGTAQDVDSPTRLDTMSEILVDDIACGTEHTAALAENTLYTWGCGYNGRLGHGTIVHKFLPTPVEVYGVKLVTDDDDDEEEVLFFADEVEEDKPDDAPKEKATVLSIYAGGCNTAAVVQDGSRTSGQILYICGLNANGQVGNNQKEDCLTPVEVVLEHGKRVTHVSFGEKHAAAIVDGKSLYTWGSNEFYQQGLPERRDILKPYGHSLVSGSSFETLGNVAEVVCGVTHTLIAKLDSRTYSYSIATAGTGTMGQLGMGPGKVEIKSFAKGLEGLPSMVSKPLLVCGEFHSAVLIKGSVYVWGDNRFGQLGSHGRRGEDTYTALEALFATKPSDCAEANRLTSAVRPPESGSVDAQWLPIEMTNLNYVESMCSAGCTGGVHTLALIPARAIGSQIITDNNLHAAAQLLTPNEDTGQRVLDKPHFSCWGATEPLRWRMFHAATFNNSPEMIKLLADHPTFERNYISAPGKAGISAIHLACMLGYSQCIQALLECGADINVRTDAGRTPLHMAVLHGNKYLVRKVAGQPNVEPLLRDHRNMTALDYATLEQTFDMKIAMNVFDLVVVNDPSDQDFARQLSVSLAKYYIHCATGKIDRPTLEDRITKAKAVLFVVTKASASSEDCLQILEYSSKSADKPIYSVWKEKAQFSSVLESLIFRRQLVDLTEKSKYKEGVASLVAGLRNVLVDKKASSSSTGDEDENTDAGEAPDKEELDQYSNPSFDDDKAPPLELVKKDPNLRYLFISYEGGDRIRARRLRQQLTQRGFICHPLNVFDSTSIGDYIHHCWAFILALSNRAARSQPVKDQLALAENRQKLILPVIIQKESKVRLDAALEYTLSRAPTFHMYSHCDHVMPGLEYADRLCFTIRMARDADGKAQTMRKLNTALRDTKSALSEKEQQLQMINERVKAIQSKKERLKGNVRSDDI